MIMSGKFRFLRALLSIGLVGTMLFSVGCSKNTSEDSYYLDYEYYYDEESSSQGSSDKDNDSDSKVNTPSKNNSSSGKTDDNTASGTNGDSNVEKVDVRGYKYTIYSPWLPTDETGITSEFEEVLFARIKGKRCFVSKQIKHKIKDENNE